MKKLLVLASSILLGILLSWQTVAAAQLSLTTKTRLVKVNQQLTVDVHLSGGEMTLGTDLIVLYDSQALSALTVTGSSLYPTYNPSASRRLDQEKGKVVISGSGNVNQPVKAEGKFASIRFQAKTAGKTFVRIDYEPGQTTKSGVIDFRGQDLVTNVSEPLEIIIQAPSIIDSLLSFLQNLLAQFRQLIP